MDNPITIDLVDIDKLCDALAMDILKASRFIKKQHAVSYKGMVAEQIGPSQYRLYHAPDDYTVVRDPAVIADINAAFRAQASTISYKPDASNYECYLTKPIMVEFFHRMMRVTIGSGIAYLRVPPGLAFRGQKPNSIGPIVFRNVKNEEYGLLLSECQLLWEDELRTA